MNKLTPEQQQLMDEAQEQYARLAALLEQDNGPFATKMKELPGMGKWFFSDYPSYLQRRAAVEVIHGLMSDGEEGGSA